MKIDGIAHIGITVSELERSIHFYCHCLGFSLLRTNHFGEPFFERYQSLYQLQEGTTCDTAVLVSPDGVQLELFQFSKMTKRDLCLWNRTGITHIAVTTSDVPAFAEQLKAENATFCMEVGIRPDGGHWLFIRDPDGNMVEIMEPFRL